MVNVLEHAVSLRGDQQFFGKKIEIFLLSKKILNLILINKIYTLMRLSTLMWPQKN